MKVLVTGATGFIGNHVLRMALEQGDEVRAMVLPGESREPLAGLDVEIVEGDLTRPDTLKAPVEGVEGVYHLAAIYALWLPDPALMYRVNVEGTRALLENAMAAGVKKVVFTSSVAAIGIRDDGEPADETTAFNQWAANDYVLSKYVSEQMVRGLVAEGLPAVIVNPGFPFGPGDRVPTPTGNLMLQILKGQMRYSFPGGVCAVDVRDVARGHLLAMERGEIGQGYILANAEGNVSYTELAKLVGDVAGVANVAVKKVGPGIMLAVARLMDAYSALTKRKPLTTLKTTRTALQRVWVDPSKAVRELGLPQTPLRTSVEDAVAWFRANGYA